MQTIPLLPEFASAGSDVLTPDQRRHCMSCIRGRDTKPERIVRSLVFRMGYRYRLHDRRLPGKPDLVFRGRRKVIFVHGCFWHTHDCRNGQVKPKTNSDFWESKRRRTQERDAENIAALEKAMWTSLIIWECETKDAATLVKKLRKFLD
ncbi:very short patch repair endonuclease [Thiocystis minor]|uniref:very short patch repair endonuclease n=1 Tax=Thiocystis minor TaxID=61597 RepID=UPI001911542C|nr:very short patch repair endonuclease [Thiocystis minor]MBK5964822.1 very short patch repair endonuclease [Thiocystis minor]